MDATAQINEIVGGLERLANRPLELVGEDRTFMEMWGWNMPAMNRHKFSAFIKSPVPRLQKMQGVDVSETDFRTLSLIPSQISYIEGNVINNLPGGNAFHVYVTIDSLLVKIRAICDVYVPAPVDLEEVEDKNLLPPSIILSLKKIKSDIDDITKNKRGLEDRVSAIINASSIAKNLPREIGDLQSAKESYTNTQSLISTNISATESAKKKANEIILTIEQLEKSAIELVKNTQGALNAATNVALGREFDLKAKALSVQVKNLSWALLVVLGLAGLITLFRVSAIHDIVKTEPLNMELVWANVITMFATLGPTIWLAWLVTKQIGQRFRLSEDYAFKASVAKAYSGYREEASRLSDIEFEKKLFATAIKRIDEEPLRYVDKENEATPWHEVVTRIFRRPNAPKDERELLLMIAEAALKQSSGDKTQSP